MKIQMMVKDPNLTTSFDEVTSHLNEEEKEACLKVFKKWTKWDEYVKIELDTETLEANLLRI